MKNDVIDILFYLFDHYMDDEIDLTADYERLWEEMRAAGFDGTLVTKAFDWLQTLAEAPDSEIVSPAKQSIRVYSSEEERRLDVECRGFIFFLEQTGIIDSDDREMIIDRVMALEVDDVDLEQLKWIILMVLFNQPGHGEAFGRMEELVADELDGSLH